MKVFARDSAELAVKTLQCWQKVYDLRTYATENRRERESEREKNTKRQMENGKQEMAEKAKLTKGNSGVWRLYDWQHFVAFNDSVRKAFYLICSKGKYMNEIAISFLLPVGTSLFSLSSPSRYMLPCKCVQCEVISDHHYFEYIASFISTSKSKIVKAIK